MLETLSAETPLALVAGPLTGLLRERTHARRQAQVQRGLQRAQYEASSVQAYTARSQSFVMSQVRDWKFGFEQTPGMDTHAYGTAERYRIPRGWGCAWHTGERVRQLPRSAGGGGRASSGVRRVPERADGVLPLPATHGRARVPRHRPRLPRQARRRRRRDSGEGPRDGLEQRDHGMWSS